MTAPTEYRRINRQIIGEAPGPTLILVGGIHGNEPSGVIAARRVLDRLTAEEIPVRGEIVAINGNLKALNGKQRYLDRDLNRQWSERRVESVMAGNVAGGLDAEDHELKEIWEQIRAAVDRARGEIYFIDMHTSSADGAPFLTVGDTLRNRAFAMEVGLPLILGLEEQVDGALLEFMNNRGYVTLGIEAGQHDCPKSIDHHEAVLWRALGTSGAIERSRTPEPERWIDVLKKASASTPKVIEVRRRHAITSEDDFRMRPGYRNFQPVAKKEHLGDDRRGQVRAVESGMILLPLYQGQGNDGFFLCREFSRLWLVVSTYLRRLKLEGLMHWLPGVSQHPEFERTLVVNTRVARFYPLEVFHLFGYRKRRKKGDLLVVSRRRYDRPVSA
ncbi:hypothetical protein ABI59_09355 [Acidobacteria bacterium Mor1]|nr:hypothetical protein ABI59_09355 [Acidobacteria bacterium Mor1]